MQLSEAPRNELQRARGALHAMHDAPSLDQFEEHWKEFLRRLERAWNKTVNHYGKSPKWHAWVGKVDAMRKQDPLLAYLINARGADEHTVSDITSRTPGGIGINPAVGNYVDRMEIGMKDGRLEVRSTTPLKVSFIPGKVALLAVVNRGRTYQVPQAHAGKPIQPDNVPGLAELALAFYERSLWEAEAFFVK